MQHKRLTPGGDKVCYLECKYICGLTLTCPHSTASVCSERWLSDSSLPCSVSPGCGSGTAVLGPAVQTAVLQRSRTTDGPGSASCGAAGAPARTSVSAAPEQIASPLHAASPEIGGLLALDLREQNKSQKT